MDRLKGKVAVITGANSGVGEATALAFAKEGATVVISARRIEPLNAVADKIKAEGGTVLAVPTDISDKAACENLMDKAVEAFGKIDILVNNAGVLESGLKPIDRFNDDDLDRIINTNEKGTMCNGLRRCGLCCVKGGYCRHHKAHSNALCGQAYPLQCCLPGKYSHPYDSKRFK